MNTSLSKKWWLVTLKGIFVLALGGILLANPYVVTEAILLFFAATLFVTGVLYIAFSLYNKSTLPSWKWHFAEGIFDIALSILMFAFPVSTLLLVATLGGVWILLSGTFQLAFRWRSKDKMKGWKYSIANGLLAFIMGGTIIFYPISGIIAFALIFELTLFVFGFFLILTSWKMKSHFVQFQA